MALRVGTRSWFALASLLLAGLVLVHLRVLIFALCLLAIMSLVWAIRQPWAVIRQRAVVAMVSAAVAVVLSLPWLWTAAVRVLLPAVEQPQTLVSRSSYNRLNTGLLWAGHNRLLVAVALASSFVLLWRRRVGVTMLVGWVALLVTLANPWLMSYLLPMCGALLLLAAIGNRRLWQGFSGVLLLLLNPLLVTFPAIWLLNTEAVIISLFVPLGVLIGGGTALLWAWLCHIRWPRWRVLAQSTCMLTLCALALWGAWNSRQVINPVTMLATDADLEAIEWVDSHTSEDARFLINAAGWLPLADRGTDGGWWLLPLTGRWISTPPVLYTYGAPDYVQQVQRQSRLVSGYEPGQEAQIKQLIAEAGITHIYLGAESEPLTREIFSADPNIEVIYEQNGITILAVKRQS
jgi:hypothetical protein